MATAEHVIPASRGSGRLRPRFARVGWVLMTFLCLATLSLVAHYLQFNPATYSKSSARSTSSAR